MKTMAISYKFVEFIPDKLEEGVIYISEPYKTAIHKCCCGCGEEVVTPLNPTDWSMLITHNKITLYPSIGNWSFACRSHYWIRNGQVVWSGQMTDSQIQNIRDQDKRFKEQYFKKINQERTISSTQTNWIDRVINVVKKWFGY